MKVDGTGVCKKMSVLASKLISENTDNKERTLIAFKHNVSISLVDKILNQSRNYTPKNAALVVQLFEQAIKNKNK